MNDADTEVAILRAVLNEPGDDLPRLAYADFLTDRGGPDDMDRADFVRAQVELASRWERAPHRRCPKTGEPHRKFASFTTRCRCPLCRLKRREYLSARRHIHWAWPPEPRWPFRTDDWHRGFLRSVTCPAETWLPSADAWLAAQPLRDATLTTGLTVAVAGDGWRPGFVWLALPGRKAEETWRLVKVPPGLPDVLDRSHVPALLAAAWPGVRFTLPPA